jgi:hypothetical protein
MWIRRFALSTQFEYFDSMANATVVGVQRAQTYFCDSSDNFKLILPTTSREMTFFDFSLNQNQRL